MCPALRDVPTQLKRRKPTGGGKISPGNQTGFKGSFVPGFQTKFNQRKSGYDLVFNGGRGSSRCVNTPPIKRLRLNKV